MHQAAAAACYLQAACCCQQQWRTDPLMPARSPAHPSPQVLVEMEKEYAENVLLVSMNSISKGFFGECGR